MNVALIILSAGSSTRMGTTKQLLAIGETTLLGLSIKHAQKSKADKVICILGANAKIIQDAIKSYDIDIVTNQNHKEGLSSSIVEGINHIENKNIDAVLIMLADQPKIDSNYLNKLLFSSEKNPTQIIASLYDDTIGVPAVFPKRYFNKLKELKGDKGAKDFLNTHKTEVISIKSEKLIDIDTKDDYLNFLKSL